MFSIKVTERTNEGRGALSALALRLALGMIGISLVAGGIVSCGAEKTKKESAAPTPTPRSNGDSNAKPETDQRVVDLAKLAAPCAENEEDTARLISSDNVPIVQFCRNRKWGNPYFEASSVRCLHIGFIPTITEDKRGVSCRNAQGLVSLNTQWKPSGQGLEACDAGEMNKWFSALDKDGVRIALRCTGLGVFDGQQPKTRFLCADSDPSYRLVFINEGEGVACRRDDGPKQIYSLFTAQLGTYLANANCPKRDQWEYYKQRDGRTCAGKCDATDDQVPGLFINQNSPGSTVCCPFGVNVEVATDRGSARCLPPTP
jgi:hypothetical protein